MNKYSIWMTFWVFDIFHEGHEKFIKSLLNKTDKLFIVLMEDKKVKEKKGKKSIFNTKLRKLIIQKKLDKEFKEWKVFILEGKENPYLDLIEIKPDIVFIGYDQNFEWKVEQAWFSYEKMKETDSYNPEKNKSSIIREIIRRKE